MCQVVCECVGTVCVALQGTHVGECIVILADLTSSVGQDVSFTH